MYKFKIKQKQYISCFLICLFIFQLFYVYGEAKIIYNDVNIRILVYDNDTVRIEQECKGTNDCDFDFKLNKNVNIYAQPTSRSRLLYTAKKGEFLYGISSAYIGKPEIGRKIKKYPFNNSIDHQIKEGDIVKIYLEAYEDIYYIGHDNNVYLVELDYDCIQEIKSRKKAKEEQKCGYFIKSETKNNYLFWYKVKVKNSDKKLILTGWALSYY